MQEEPLGSSGSLALTPTAEYLKDEKTLKSHGPIPLYYMVYEP